ncbi:MAG: alpha/beta hydrolase [Bacteroidota bacterium]
MCPPSDELTAADFYLAVSQGTLEVFRYGNGPKVVLALPGFDYDARVFGTWEAVLGEDFTIYAIQLPFHGGSRWNKRSFQPIDWQEVFTTLADQVGAECFHLAGHSLGGRIVVCCAPELQDRIDQVWLLAPAGIGAFDRVLPIWFQRVAETALKWPGWLRFFVNLGSKIGLVSNFHRRYAEVQLYPADKRNRLFRVYNSIAYFRTGTATLRRFWSTDHMPTILLVARQDRFVPTEKIKAYFSAAPKVITREIDGTHHLVTASSAALIKAAQEKFLK